MIQPSVHDETILETGQKRERSGKRLDLIGPIVRLQVQTEPLKRGERGSRWYDPAPITAVDALHLDAGGVRGTSAAVTLLDVHHRDHPRSRHRGGNGVSVGFTAHYASMRETFDIQLSDGVAGENVLVDTARAYTEAEFGGGLVIETAEGPVRLDRVIVAAPCVEFSKFCVGLDAGDRPDRRVTEALQFLDGGTRGFYATWRPADDRVRPVIRPGDRVYRLVPGDVAGA